MCSSFKDVSAPINCKRHPHFILRLIGLGNDLRRSDVENLRSTPYKMPKVVASKPPKPHLDVSAMVASLSRTIKEPARSD